MDFVTRKGDGTIKVMARLSRLARYDRENQSMTTITVQEAQSHLFEIIERLIPGEEIVLTRDHKPVATMRSVQEPGPRKPRQLGTLRGSVLYMAPDFDAIPEGFEEYVGCVSRL